MKITLLVLALLAGVSPALAHELPGPHAHPHGDFASTVALLIAFAGFGVVALYRWNRRK